MTDDPQRTELLQSYLNADTSSRHQKFTGFLQSLKSLAEVEGAEAARVWAGRAVSPLLDYSSLMKLRRFLRSRKPAEGRGNALRLAILGGPTTTQLRQFIEVFLAAKESPSRSTRGTTAFSARRSSRPARGSMRSNLKSCSWRPAPGMCRGFPRIEMDEQAVAADRGRRTRRLVPALGDGQRPLERDADPEQLRDSVIAFWGTTGCGIRRPAKIISSGSIGRWPSAPRVRRDARLAGLAAEAGARAGSIRGFISSSKCPAGPSACLSMPTASSRCCGPCWGAARRCWSSTWTTRSGAASWATSGPGGIRFGQGSGEGEAFLAFQRYAKELPLRGILLAVCSKNDEEGAGAVRETGRHDPAAGRHLGFVANWENKADNLRTIADRLELGLDSFVFVDDNPAERAHRPPHSCRKSRYPICRRTRRATPRRSLVTVISRRVRSRARIRPGLAIIPRTRGGKSWPPAPPTWNRSSPRCT